VKSFGGEIIGGVQGQLVEMVACSWGEPKRNEGHSLGQLALFALGQQPAEECC